jgi:hypothetical protein
LNFIFDLRLCEFSSFLDSLINEKIDNFNVPHRIINKASSPSYKLLSVVCTRTKFLDSRALHDKMSGYQPSFDTGARNGV